ncbi:hypothetical protein [Streptomyces sp. NPDC059247]|uniref:hypothetical protein n=1 Tax=Streptomyces sp. NPDC059247 TaxID=3346790 RepID=UPI0036AD5CF4
MTHGRGRLQALLVAVLGTVLAAAGLMVGGTGTAAAVEGAPTPPQARTRTRWSC